MKTIFLALLAFLTACQARPTFVPTSPAVQNDTPASPTQRAELRTLLRGRFQSDCQASTIGPAAASFCSCTADVMAANATVDEYEGFIRDSAGTQSWGDLANFHALMRRVQPQINRQCVRAGP